MFDLLRDAANNQYIVALDVEIEDGKQNGLATRWVFPARDPRRRDADG